MRVTLQVSVVALLAVAGYRRARWFRGRYGRTPWGWPPIVWALVFGLSLLLGALLLVIAERSGRCARVLPGPAAAPAPQGASHGGAAQPSAHFAWMASQETPSYGGGYGPPSGNGAPSADPPAATGAGSGPALPVPGQPGADPAPYPAWTPPESQPPTYRR